MRIFNHDFKNLGESQLEDLAMLERESAIYSDFWIDELDDFRHTRVQFADDEVAEYVRSMKAYDLFLGSGKRWARDVPEIPADIAARADAYKMRKPDGEVVHPWHCPAAFMGPEIEALLCFDRSRRQVLEEQGTAAFLSTIRRAVDALRPAVRCFSNRETGLRSWAVMREDDVRDLLYAMLRASISDIKREEPVPSKAGSSRVADLHSRLAKTLIEIKWIGKGSRWRRILEEIHADVQTYSRHPDCRYLIFIIVDAARAVPDPHLVETDLTGTQVIGDKSVNIIAYVREP